MGNLFFRLGILLLPLVSAKVGQCQQKPTDTTREGKTIIIIGADRYNFQQLDSGTQFVSLVGHAIVQQEHTTFSADSIVLNQKLNTLEAIGNVHINDADSIHTYSQYLRYVGKEKKAYLSNKVKLTDGKGILTTDDLVYDMQLKTGTYTNGGKVINGKTILTSKEGYYYGETRDVYFKKNVVLIEPDAKILTDTLLYNLNTSKSTFVAPTKIYNGKRTITTTDGYFDTKTQQGYFGKRTLIDDSTYTFAADKAAIDEQTGLSEYQGNAVYRSKDTVGGYDLIAGNIKVNKKTGSILATKKPVLFIKQAKDTIYVSADTLYSSKLSQLIKSRLVPLVRESIKPAVVKKPASKDTVNIIKKTADSLQLAQKSNLRMLHVNDELKNSRVVDSSLAMANKDSTIAKKLIDTTHHVSLTIYGDSSRSKKKMGDSLNTNLSTLITFKDSLGKKTADSSKATVKKARKTPAFFFDPSIYLDSSKALKDTNNDRFFEAYNNVKIFSDSMQAVADSMFYSLEDSTFRLFKNPVAWAQNNQVTGDTMLLFLANKKPERLSVYENAMAIEKAGASYFNQVKGNSINAYFLRGKMDHLRAKGNAETVYYGQDERKRFIGVNKANCDIIDMYFEQKKDESSPQRIVLRNNLTGTAYPMGQINYEELKLRNFKWLDANRPKTKFDILAN
ncbi:OstA-like protein [Parasediminibacterium sp. JCM 36343]|uniref:OstA-like protein n=1 Tax=Parasediminibacterium sp. JCM 36343 TaxID=3374279 RepID=UPI003979026F